MRKKLTIIFLLLFLNVKGQSIKNGIITYKISISETSIKKYYSSKREKIKNNKVIEYWDNYYNENNTTEGILKFKGYNSVYELKKTIKNESNLRYTTIDIFSGGKNTYFTNNAKKENIKQDCDLLGECFLIENPNIEWKLTQTIRIIQGYKCYKAEIITKRNNKKVVVSAWYTNEIPANFGPLNYSGLPGLILELNDGDIIFKVKKIILNPKKEVKIKFSKKGIKITEEKFLKLAKKSFPKELFKN